MSEKEKERERKEMGAEGILITLMMEMYTEEDVVQCLKLNHEELCKCEKRTIVYE